MLSAFSQTQTFTRATDIHKPNLYVKGKIKYPCVSETLLSSHRQEQHKMYNTVVKIAAQITPDPFSPCRLFEAARCLMLQNLLFKLLKTLQV